ncbi:MAG: TatD family hydrolase [Pseudomonadales bacterium]
MYSSLIDIGANLAHSSFSDDLSQLIERATLTGVSQIVVTGTSVANSKDSIRIAGLYPDVCYATAGVHPHEADTFSAADIDSLRGLASNDCVKAIGEAGLDYNRNYSQRSNQLKAFEAQLTLAAELNMPIFVHERDAADDMLSVLARYRASIGKIVVHCFTGAEATLKAYLDLDLYIGITGWICDERRGQHLRELVSLIPSGRLMLETDSPYLMPRDFPNKKSLQSSRRNEPCTLAHTAATIASCRGESYEELAEHTTRTSRDFFSLPSS